MTRPKKAGEKLSEDQTVNEKLSEKVRSGKYTFYCPTCDDNTASSSSLPEFAKAIAALEQQLTDCSEREAYNASAFEELKQQRDDLRMKLADEKAATQRAIDGALESLRTHIVCNLLADPNIIGTSAYYAVAKLVDDIDERINSNPLADLQAQLAAKDEELEKIKDAIGIAYAYLWRVNNEPGTPNQYKPERAAYEARRRLRDFLSSEQRGKAICAVTELMQPNQEPQK